MPAVVAIPLIAAAVSGGAAVAGSKMASNASRRATDANARGLNEQIAYEREKDAEARRQFDAVEARKAPFREMRDSVLRRRASSLGLPMPAATTAPTYSAAAPPTYRGDSMNNTVVTPRGQTLGDILYGSGSSR